MRFRCPFCYYTISVDDTSRGYPVVCAGCGKEVMIPPGRFDPGCIIGDFVILEKLGAGSIGTVYKATQLSLDRQVALKILSPEYTTSKGIDDFLREARAAAKLSHTNLVQAYAVGEDDGFCYLAMTYVNGENLRTRLRKEGRIPVDEALHIVQQVAEALYYAWDEAGLIHRDVKPDNIMITEDGIVKLTDLGLAMNQSEWTENMEISGSPSYMSPEQFRGEKLDPRSDVYSLGVTLFQMISGRLPFESDSVKKLAQMHLEKEPPSLRHLVPGVPLAVDALVKRMMAKRPENRYASMEEVLKSIWTIRQKTAPNRSLVPDVHTISIKRLDYEIQNESSELKAKVAEKIVVRASWMDRLITGFVTAVGVIVLMLILFAVFGGGETKLQTYDKVSYFEKLSGDKSLDVAAILEEGRKILEELPNRGSAQQEYNLAKMKTLLSSVELNALRNESLQLKQEKSALTQRSQQLEEEKKRLTQRNTQLERMVGEYSNYGELKRRLEEKDDRIGVLEENAAGQKKEIARLQGRVETLHRESLDRTRNEIRMKLLEFQLEYRFRMADALIQAEKRRVPSLETWLNEKEKENSLLQKIYQLLTDSGTRFAGYPLGYAKGMSILNINSGTISYKDALGRTFLKEWREFQPRTLYRLLQYDSAMKRNLKAAEAGCELLQERIGAACRKNPGDKELQALAAVYADNKVKELNYAVAADPEKGREAVRAFLRDMEGAEIYGKLERELNGLLR